MTTINMNTDEGLNLVGGEVVRFGGKLVRRWEARKNPWNSATEDYDRSVTFTSAHFLAPQRATQAKVVQAYYEYMDNSDTALGRMYA